jgi:hypothetical protein
MNVGDYQNDIADLDPISDERYENIFKVYNITDPDKGYYFYNILNKINIPSNIDESLLGFFDLDTKLPWTTFSYKIYRSQYLWWLIFLLNKPENIFYAEPGIRYKYLLPEYVNIVLNNILEQLN